jgi:hypothetical protein
MGFLIVVFLQKVWPVRGTLFVMFCKKKLFRVIVCGVCAHEKKNNFHAQGRENLAMAVCLVSLVSGVCLRALNTQQTRAHFTISAPNCKLKLAHNN